MIAMRTTIDLDEESMRAVQRLRDEQGRGLSEAVNELIRRGLVAREDVPGFRPRTAPLGIRIDVSDVAGAIEVLEGPEAR